MKAAKLWVVSFLLAALSVAQCAFAEKASTDVASKPVVQGKIVGVWDHTGKGLHNGDWEKTMAALAEAGITDVFMDCRIHKNRFLGDMVKACAAAGKAHGVRVHVWICCFQGAEREPTPQSRRDEVAGWAERIARDYEVDGIHLDYVRWSSKSKEERQPELMTAFVRDVGRRIRKARPGILFTTAVFPSYPDCRDDVGQDWNDWLDYGLVDYVLPMNYTGSEKKYVGYLEQQSKSASRASKTISGIGVTASGVTLGPDEVKRQTALALERGMAGVCYFDLDKTFEEEIMPVLRGSGAASKEIRLEAAKARPYKDGFSLDGSEIVCSVGTNAERTCGAGWHVSLKQGAPAAVLVSAEGMVESGNGSGEVLLYIDVAYMDGDHLWGQKRSFPAVPCDWRKRTVVIVPPKPIRSLSAYVMAKKGAGLRARFRPPVISAFAEDGGQTVFDGVPVQASEALRTPGFMIRDARAGGGFAKESDGSAGVRIESTCEEKSGARFIEASLTDEKGGDRALTLVWAMPLGGGKLTWFDSPRTAVDATDAKGDLRTTVAAQCGAGCYSRWPFLAAAVDGKGIAVGLDPRLPAFSRVSLHAGLRLLYAAFDVALVPEKKSARVGLVAFPFEAKDGFRGALEAYQRLFPEFNEVKQTKQGNWMAFRKISKVQGWEDFGFAIKEGDGETAWDDEHGITTYHYTEPSTWWMRIKGRDGRAQATMEECIAEAERLAAKGDSLARAWKACAMKDELGRTCGRIKDEPWCKGIVWNLNCSPGQGPDCEFNAKLGDEYFTKHYSGTFPEGLDGEYVDSSEMYVTDPVDYNRANFAGMDTPLTFSVDELRPCVFKGMMAYEYVRGVWRKARAIGRRTMANSTPRQWWWLAPHLDVMGTETDWHHNGKWRPMSDAELMYMRAISGAKPFCFLMNTDFRTFTVEMVDKYMQRSLAYGMYPSFFSANASSNHYFDNPTLYNRDRHLFRKYMPLCIRVGEAGWRPVNRLVASDSSDVITEQFGDRYATVFNLGTNAVNAVLTSLSGAAEAEELVGGGTWRFEGGRRQVEIPGETVFVLSFGSHLPRP